MKAMLFTICLALNIVSLASVGQSVLNQLNPLELDANEFSDLDAFGEAIGDKRIVILDELSHGEKEVFLLKNKLVRYLHQEKGFEVFMIESGIFDVFRMWQENHKTIKTNAPGNIFYMYANSQGGQQLFDYIDKNRKSARPLYLVGFDGRHTGKYSKSELVNFVKSSSAKFFPDYETRNDWPVFFKQLQKVIDNQIADFNVAQKHQYIRLSYQFIDELLALNTNMPGFESPKFVALIIKGILFSAEEKWGMRRHDEPGLVMAEITTWLLDNVYQNKKVVIWGHYIHLNKVGAEINRYANVGTKIQENYGNQTYFAHIAGVQGSYREFRDLSIFQLERLSDSRFEYHALPLIAKGKKQRLFIDKAHVNMNFAKDLTLWGHEYKTTIPVKYWANHWDGMFLLSKVNASR